MTRLASIPVVVREAMGAILELARKQNRPFGVTEAVDQVRRQFPDLEVSDNDLVEAIAEQAVAAGVEMDLALSTDNRTGQGGLREFGEDGGAASQRRNEQRAHKQGEAGIIENNEM